MRESERELERMKLLRRITYLRWGPGRRANHIGGTDPRIAPLQDRLRALDERREGE